jgi:AraC-like DNA-binding protein
MLETLGFFPRPQGFSNRVLGVIVSHNSTLHAIDFSVPAHVFLTLNVVLNGHIKIDDRVLSTSFVTGPHTQSRRYTLTAKARLWTLFCKADAISQLCDDPPSQLVDTWRTSSSVFPAWQEPFGVETDIETVARRMLHCVSPSNFVMQSASSDEISLRIQKAVHALSTTSISNVTKQLGVSERSLERLFKATWGVRPKLVQRILRINQALEIWNDGRTKPDLADLSAQLGLTDQAHLAREFRHLVGYPPGALKLAITNKQPANDSQSNQDLLWALRTGHSLLRPLLN